MSERTYRSSKTDSYKSLEIPTVVVDQVREIAHGNFLSSWHEQCRTFEGALELLRTIPLWYDTCWELARTSKASRRYKCLHTAFWKTLQLDQGLEAYHGCSNSPFILSYRGLAMSECTILGIDSSVDKGHIAFRHWLQDLRSAIVLAEAGTPKFQRKTTLGFYTRDKIEEGFVALMAVMHNLVFGVTNQGYIGMLPTLAKHGDTIHKFPHTNVPFVMRKVDGGYRLIGDCFVQGIMNGEFGGAESDWDKMDKIRII